jgi:hypothetical protein
MSEAKPVFFPQGWNSISFDPLPYANRHPVAYGHTPGVPRVERPRSPIDTRRPRIPERVFWRPHIVNDEYRESVIQEILADSRSRAPINQWEVDEEASDSDATEPQPAAAIPSVPSPDTMD